MRSDRTCHTNDLKKLMTVGCFAALTFYGCREFLHSINSDFLNTNCFSDLGVAVTTQFRHGNFQGASFSFANPGSYQIEYLTQNPKAGPTKRAEFNIVVPEQVTNSRFSTNLPSPASDVATIALSGHGRFLRYDWLMSGTEIKK